MMTILLILNKHKPKIFNNNNNNNNKHKFNNN